MKDWKEIERVFHLAVQEEPDKRESLLERECRDPELREDVLALLASHSEASDFLERPVVELPSGSLEQPTAVSNDSGFRPSDVERPAPGRDLSHYHILDRLGRGGMGEVFLAEDTSLGRKVALKFLPKFLEKDDAARKRFLREAKTIAALDHPYICHVNEVGETASGQDFIVMEYIEGQTLKDRLVETVLPVREAIRIACEVAEALEKAHKAGIVHRDLKPANIMLTPDGHAKVMDFGLAKRILGEDGQGTDFSSDLTREGMAVGTLAYMSPEQIQGHTLDHRSDIFSFGIVLFEMLAQIHPFRRPSPMETVNAILKEDPPPLFRSGEIIPAGLRSALERMLHKNPARRQQSIADVRSDLTDAEDALGSTPAELWRKVRLALPWKQILPWALVPVAAIVGVMGTAWLHKTRGLPRDLSRIRSEFLLPSSLRVTHWFRHGLAISPDSQYLAFVADHEEQDLRSHWQPQRSQIYLRRLDQWSVQAIPGTDHSYQPVFSPDGKWLCFVQVDPETGKYSLRKIGLDGTEATTLCETDMPYGACWGPDGIIFAEKVGGLLKIPANGGVPERITELAEDSGEVSHRLPHVLPDNRGILYTSITSPIPAWNEAPLWVHSTKTGERRLLLEGGSDVRYVPTGHLVFALEGQLMAAPFDLDELAVTGPPVTVLEGVSHSVHTGGEWQEVGAAQFAVSAGGLVVYGPGSVFPEPGFSIVWVDRKGREEPLEIDPRKYVRVRVSPDGRQILLAHFYTPGGLWILDLERSILRRQTFRGPMGNAVWGPGPDHFTVAADLNGVLIKRIDSGPEAYERIPAGSARGKGVVPGNWSPDGKWLTAVSSPGPADIWLISSNSESKPFLETRYQEEFPEFSPDGKWLAYASTESGRYEIYVRPVSRTGTATQISNEGGHAPAWARNGREIFFRGADGSIQGATIRTEGDRLLADRPVRLFKGNYPEAYPIRSWDVAPDGRFLMLKDLDRPGWVSIFHETYFDRVRIEQNWFEILTDLVPTG